MFFISLMFFGVSINAQTIRDNFQFALSDSTPSLYSFKSMNSDYLNSNLRHSHSTLNIAGQVVAGSSFALIFTLPSVYITFHALYNHKTDKVVDAGLLFLMCSSYIFGAAVGVDWIASMEYENNSLPETLGYSAIGSGASLLLLGILSTQYHQIPTSGVLTALFCPVLSSVLFTTLISDWPVQEKVTQDYIKPGQLHFHRDLVEESMQIRINIFQLRF